MVSINLNQKQAVLIVQALQLVQTKAAEIIQSIDFSFKEEQDKIKLQETSDKKVEPEENKANIA